MLKHKNWNLSLGLPRLTTILDKLSTVKKAFEPKKAARKQATTSKALALLDEITTAYTASTEPDLNISQIFTDRNKTNGWKIDFN
ncbi:MAG: hypothetical protein IPM82_25500 [Saprospiraceae bacterium]|nr:hypothetical protein [Saprospiraceae bacterium]